MPEAPAIQVSRDSKTGRFLPGVSGNPNGGPHKKTLTAALREIVDPDKAAKELWRRALKSDTVLMYAFDRLEGRPMQSTEIHGPRDEAYLEVLERVRLAVERRALVLRGELASGEPADDSAAL